jgi:3'-phosphoadenosine 5'-phosphosulfate sulfotransferase (PAPS reductase)/FAD synthetase
MTDLTARIAEAHAIIDQAVLELGSPDRVLLALSGGKDSMIAAHLAKQHGIRAAVCETSWTFACILDHARRFARSQQLRVTYTAVVADPAWLRRHQRIIFTDDTKLRAWTFHVRQHRAINEVAARDGHTGTLTGRRTAENAVPAPIYRTKDDVLRVHPLRSWSTPEAWAYIEQHRLKVSPAYATPFAQTGPFYTLRESKAGSRAAAWDVCADLDPTFTPEQLGVDR